MRFFAKLWNLDANIKSKILLINLQKINKSKQIYQSLNILYLLYHFLFGNLLFDLLPLRVGELS